MRDYLDDTFLKWIGRRGPVESPPTPRSPDLTPCDFSLWGIIKDRFYAQNTRDINHLKPLIEQEFTSLNDNIESCQAVCRSIADRCQMCIDVRAEILDAQLVGYPWVAILYYAVVAGFILYMLPQLYGVLSDTSIRCRRSFTEGMINTPQVV